MKKSSKKLIVALLCAAAAVLIGLVAYDGIKQSREFSSSSAMMNTAVSADIEGKDAKKVGKAVFDCISELENKLLSRHIETSAVSEINDAAGQSVKITLFSSSANEKINDPEKKMGNILSKCEERYKNTVGYGARPRLGRQGHRLRRGARSARKFKNKARGRLRRREHTSLRRGRKIHCRDKRSFFGELD